MPIYNKTTRKKKRIENPRQNKTKWIQFLNSVNCAQHFIYTYIVFRTCHSFHLYSICRFYLAEHIARNLYFNMLLQFATDATDAAVATPPRLRTLSFKAVFWLLLNFHSQNYIKQNQLFFFCVFWTKKKMLETIENIINYLKYFSLLMHMHLVHSVASLKIALNSSCTRKINWQDKHIVNELNLFSAGI